jgi:branched-chain amino acid transport system substrate-binding protein
MTALVEFASNNIKRNLHRGALSAALVALMLFPAGQSNAAQGISSEEVLVGTHADLSGPLSSWGRSVVNGIEMAFDEANEAGGINDRTVRLIAKDDTYDSAAAEQAVRELVEMDGVFAILSPLGTPTTHVAAAAAAERETLYLFPITTVGQAPPPPSPFGFSLNRSAEAEIATGLARLLETRPGAGVGVLAPNDELGNQVRAGVGSYLSEIGMEPATDVTIARGASDYSYPLRWLRERDVDVIVLSAIGEEAIGVMQAARQLRWRPTFLCPSSCYTPELAALGGEIVDGLFAVGQIPIPYGDDPILGEWARDYEEKFDMIASKQALSGYRNARLFLAVLARAGRTPTEANFRYSLETLGPWTDPLIDMPPIIFSPENHQGLHDVFLAQVQRGRWIIVPQISPTRL